MSDLSAVALCLLHAVGLAAWLRSVVRQIQQDRQVRGREIARRRGFPTFLRTVRRHLTALTPPPAVMRRGA